MSCPHELFVCFFFHSILEAIWNPIFFFISWLFQIGAALVLRILGFHLTYHQPQKHCTVTVFFNLLIKGLTHNCVLVFIHAHLHVSSSNASHFNMTFEFGYSVCARICTYTCSNGFVLYLAFWLPEKRAYVDFHFSKCIQYNQYRNAPIFLVFCFSSW